MVQLPTQTPSHPPTRPLLLVSGAGFSGWHALNDTVMGGQSSGGCTSGSKGLVMDAEVVEAGGGFVSCRSPVFSPPLDLSAYSGLQLDLRADGRRFKLALACADGLGGLTELIPGGLRWVAEFATESSGLTQVTIPFASLKASVRARPRQQPWSFEACRVTRLQVLHSRFSDDGGLNNGFRAGPLRLTLEAIRALP
ncbi:CIA30 family protein [Cyanobium sp. Morenito 9A2]|uniref:CIA30 family protein n=1 Tax=Cyanobium sp. Morenito 9A2 TaxID=2823718 RepID=UPI0020CE04A8|nr:CIA30 family protein [Cyanobium sp. Morenito 9A2]MCP9850551.1 CIA30 family protein [Cyanobium sp. Morenito 9A2]